MGKMHYIIDNRSLQGKGGAAEFEIHFNQEFKIESMTLNSISFFNSWWTLDLLSGDSKMLVNHFLKNKDHEDFKDLSVMTGHFSLADFCKFLQSELKTRNVYHVNFHCDQNNYLVIELTDDKVFQFWDYESDTNWTGFKQSKFTQKGKYYSAKPLNFYRTDLFLTCDLVDKERVNYNSQPSDILCIVPVEDEGKVKLQRHEPDCTVPVNKTTNKASFTITDENGKIVDFQGSPILIKFTLNNVKPQSQSTNFEVKLSLNHCNQ